LGPNRRAQERERAAAEAAANVKRARPTGRRSSPFGTHVRRAGSMVYPTIGAAIRAGLPWLSFSCPTCRQWGSFDLRALDATQAQRYRAWSRPFPVVDARPTFRSPGSKCWRRIGRSAIVALPLGGMDATACIRHGTCQRSGVAAVICASRRCDFSQACVSRTPSYGGPRRGWGSGRGFIPRPWVERTRTGWSVIRLL